MFSRKRIANIIIFLFYICLLTYQIYNIFIIGPLNYEIESEKGKEIIIELLLFGGFIFISNFCIKDNSKLLIIGILLLVMGYLHQTLFPIIVSTMYLVMIMITGYMIVSIFFDKKEIRNSVMIIISAIVGLNAVILCVVLLSLLNLYSIKRIWYLLIGLCTISLIFYHKDFYKMLTYYKGKIHQNCEWKMFISFIEIGLLVQFARVGLQGDFDGLWYGLRSYSVLANSEMGIFENFNFVGLPYLYPKGFEIILLPLTGFSSWNYQFLFNVGLTGLIVMISWCFIKELANRKIAYIIAGVIATIPSLMNMAMTVKSDIITVLFQLAGIYLLYLSNRDKNNRYIFMSCMCLFASYSFKITSLLFTSTTILALLPFVDLKKIRIKIKDVGIVLFGIITWFAVWMRTLILTGTPLIVYIGKILAMLGIDVKYPYTMNNSFYGSPNAMGSFIEKVINNLYGYFVLPVKEDFMHVIIAWGTSIPVVLLIIASILFFVLKKRVKEYRKWIWFMSVIVLSLLAGMMLIGQADGNYFLLYYIILTIIAGSFILLHNKEMIYLAYMATVFNIAFASFSNWSWANGFTEIKIKNKGYINQEDSKIKKFKSKHGKKLYAVLKEQDAKTLAVTQNVEELVVIKGEAELWLDVQNGNSMLIDTVESLYEYLVFSEFDYIYFDKTTIGDESVAKVFLEALVFIGAIDDIIYGKDGAILVVRSSLNEMRDQKMIEKFHNYIYE